MSRAYRAARRKVQRRDIDFDYAYEVEVDVLDEESGKPTGEKVWEERSEHFDCLGKVDTLLLSELAYNADLDTASAEGMGLIRMFFQQAIGDEAQYRRFFKLHTRYGDDDLLMEIMQGLVEDFQAEPSTQRSVSAPGPSESGEASRVVSLSQGTVRYLSEAEAEKVRAESVPGETSEAASSA